MPFTNTNVKGKKCAGRITTNPIDIPTGQHSPKHLTKTISHPLDLPKSTEATRMRQGMGEERVLGASREQHLGDPLSQVPPWSCKALSVSSAV
jgi:hypothetical protein